MAHCYPGILEFRHNTSRVHLNEGSSKTLLAKGGDPAKAYNSLMRSHQTGDLVGVEGTKTGSVLEIERVKANC